MVRQFFILVIFVLVLSPEMDRSTSEVEKKLGFSWVYISIRVSGESSTYDNSVTIKKTSHACKYHLLSKIVSNYKRATLLPVKLEFIGENSTSISNWTMQNTL